jgi:hypothetical protein
MMKRLTMMTAAVLGLAGAAGAATGSGDSAPGAIDTVPPGITALAATAPNELRVTFSEPMLPATVLDPALYGTGGNNGNLGSVGLPMVTALGGNQYALVWSATEEMGAGGSVFVTNDAQRDLAGNPTDAAFIPTATAVGDTPSPGTALIPATADTAPIAISFSGAADATSGIDRVQLYYRRDGEAWAPAPGDVSATAGVFQFTPPGSAPANHGTYHFDLVAHDHAGNHSAIPSGSAGTGQGSMLYQATSNVSDWRIIE